MKRQHALYVLFQLVVLLFACAMSAHTASAKDYWITNLGSSQSWIDRFCSWRVINASGQVAFNDVVMGTNTQHAFFYDGTTVHDIGTLGGGGSFATGVNNLGQVVGYSYTADNLTHAFSWTQAGGIIDLGTLGGNSFATGINNLGQVVGYSYTADNLTHAFSWTQTGGMVDLGTFGGKATGAVGINDLGQVVGTFSIYASAPSRAFSWTQAGGMVDLGTLGGPAATPLRVNNLGQVAGGSTVFNGYGHAFLWTQAGGMVDLGTLVEGLLYSGASDVNNLGQVVGQSFSVQGTHAFSWTQAGGMIDLGSFGGASSAWAVNNLGQVVGTANNAGNLQQRAFSWTQSDGMVDLNLHIPTAPAGMELWEGLAVSDNGSIVAQANTGLVLLGGSSTAPVIGPITANDPIATGSPIAVSATFTDKDTANTHTANWTWGDTSSPQLGTVSETGGSGTASGSHLFVDAGVYSVSLKITDSAGLSTTVSRQVVVYDPSAGFVTGGGWINSPTGAYKDDPSLAGRATFSFASKYQKGANVPTGNTAFQFQTANLNFYSNTCNWLVVAGARAQYKGIGTINGTGSYNFMLTVIDGQINGGGGVDRFRIKIWHYDETLKQDVVDYDNQIDTSTSGTVNEGALLGGGSIMIHAK